MKYVNNYRYTITSRRGVQQVYPLNEADFTITYTRQTDDKRYYKKELPSDITFKNEAYNTLLKLEKSVYRCELIDIIVERRCTDDALETWVPEWFSGRILLNDGNFDLDREQVVIKMAELEDYSCYDDNKDTKLNLLLLVGIKQTINLFSPDLEFEYLEIEVSNVIHEGGRCTGHAWTDAETAASMGYVPYSDQFINDFDPANPNADYTCTILTKYVRQKLTVACGDEAPGIDWILIADTCPNPDGIRQRIYAKPPALYGCGYDFPDPENPNYDQFTYFCGIVGVGGVQIIDDGVHLTDALKMFVGNFCSPVIVKSDFYQIDPYNPSQINYVTGVTTKTDNIVIFQKSDVKRPGVSGNATISNMSFEQLLTFLTTLHNTAWRIYYDATINKTVFRIEHVSFWSPGLGLDLTLPRYAKWVNKLRRYSYDNEAIPSRETFSFMEAQNLDFIGYPIIYDSGCVSKANSSNVKTHALDQLTTDVSLCLTNPGSDSGVVSDEGFVFIACKKANDGTLYMITEASIVGGGQQLNNSLAWAQLHRDYWKYERPVKFGNLNNQDIEFITTKPTKKGDKITIPFTCRDTFDPDNFVKTALGLGVVSVATFSFKDQTLELQLLYNAEDGLTTNDPPVAGNLVIRVMQPDFVDIDVIAASSDPQGSDTITRVEIVTQPVNGIAEVLLNNLIRYQPNPGFVGNDNMSYRVYDEWGEASNIGLIAIIVRDVNAPPVAGDISFDAIQDTVLNGDAPGILANSTDDSGFSLEIYDAVTTQGGAVTVNPDGSFSYTPPPGFTGVDTFTFTIIDDDGLEATGTVTFNVADPNVPVTVPKTYTTRKNHSKSFPATGVLFGDTTTIGVLTATPQTVASVQGGSATINADGSFTYTPPAGYVGLDSFDYIADNGTDTAPGTVTMRVFPDIYVHFQQLNIVTTNITEICDGVEVNRGSLIRTATNRLTFFSDAAGTTPFNVSGLGFVVHLNNAQTSNSGPGPIGAPSNSTLLVNATGITMDYINPGVAPDGTIRREQYDCTSTRVNYDDYVYSLLAFIDYVNI